MRDGVEHEFHPRRNSQLVENAKEIFFYGMLAELELGGDFAIAQALGDQCDDLFLASCELMVSP